MPNAVTATAKKEKTFNMNMTFARVNVSFCHIISKSPAAFIVVVMPIIPKSAISLFAQARSVVNINVPSNPSASPLAAVPFVVRMFLIAVVARRTPVMIVHAICAWNEIPPRCNIPMSAAIIIPVMTSFFCMRPAYHLSY